MIKIGGNLLQHHTKNSYDIFLDVTLIESILNLFFAMTRLIL